MRWSRGRGGCVRTAHAQLHACMLLPAAPAAPLRPLLRARPHLQHRGQVLHSRTAAAAQSSRVIEWHSPAAVGVATVHAGGTRSHPMVHRDGRLDARCQQTLDEVAVELDARLVDGAAGHALRDDARPRDGQPVVLHAQALHERDVRRPAVVHVARHVAGRVVRDLACTASRIAGATWAGAAACHMHVGAASQSPRGRAPGDCASTSQMDGDLPSASQPPSTWRHGGAADRQQRRQHPLLTQLVTAAAQRPHAAPGRPTSRCPS